MLTIENVASLKEILAPLLPNIGAIALDTHAVKRVDTAGVQLLSVFSRHVRAAGGEVRWHALSDALLRAAELLGLSEELELTS